MLPSLSYGNLVPPIFLLSLLAHGIISSQPHGEKKTSKRSNPISNPRISLLQRVFLKSLHVTLPHQNKKNWTHVPRALRLSLCSLCSFRKSALNWATCAITIECWGGWGVSGTTEWTNKIMFQLQQGGTIQNVSFQYSMPRGRSFLVGSVLSQLYFKRKYGQRKDLAQR